MYNLRNSKFIFLGLVHEGSIVMVESDYAQAASIIHYYIAPVHCNSRWSL